MTRQKQDYSFRRFFSAALSLLLVLSLCACSAKSDSGTSRTRSDLRVSTDAGRTGTGGGSGTGGSGTGGSGNTGNTATTNTPGGNTGNNTPSGPAPEISEIVCSWSYLSYVNRPHTGYYFFPDGEWVGIPLIHASYTASDDIQFLDCGFYEHTGTEGGAQVYQMYPMDGGPNMTARLSYTPEGYTYQLDLSNGDTIYGGGASADVNSWLPASYYRGKWAGEGATLELNEDGTGTVGDGAGNWKFSIRFVPGSSFMPREEGSTFEQRMFTYAFFADQGYYLCADLAYFDGSTGSEYIKVSFLSLLADACGIPQTVTMTRVR